MTKKPLELNIYPEIDRWVDVAVENYLGQTVTVAHREIGYLTERGVFSGDEWPEKQLTDAELAAEAWAFVMSDHKYPADPDEYGDEEWEAYSREHREAERTIWRFATRPHAHESDYQ